MLWRRPRPAMRAGYINSTESIDIKMSFDSVYFLMFDGWKSELRSNRWHFASRWSQEFPVVLVQPSRFLRRHRAKAEPVADIKNVEALYIPLADRRLGSFAVSVQSARDIAKHMKERGHKKPLLWIYNPRLAGAASLVPSIGRIFHASENYFDFPALDSLFIEQLKASLRLSDLVVAVSEGVASAYQPIAKDKVLTVTNGCDWHQYAGKPPDEELSRIARDWSKVATYAGNVNGRLDFELLKEATARSPRVLFALFGPVTGLSPGQESSWRQLLQISNFKHFGSVEADRLPGIYSASDLGLMPYTNDPLITKNGFPLKTFEMIATGLPVVSTYMSQLESHAAKWLLLCSGRSEFLSAVERMSRSVLSQEDQNAMDQAARSQDYGRKFAEIRTAVQAVVAGRAEAEPFANTLVLSNGADWQSAMAGADIRLLSSEDLRARALSLVRRVRRFLQLT